MSSEKGDMMETMNISLPDTLIDFVQERVASSKFSNPSDYITSLIRQDKQREAEEKIEQALLEGLNSGPSTAIDDAYWERLNQRATIIS